MATFYKVSADHRHPDYQFVNTLVRVDNRRGLFSAIHKGLGHGKERLSVADAIGELFGSHGCRLISYLPAGEDGERRWYNS